MSTELELMTAERDAALLEVDRAVAAEREEWIARLAAMCDDDWLRRRDRCMKLPGAHNRHSRDAAGAWEHAAHEIRATLVAADPTYEDSDRHRAYMAWSNGGRDGELAPGGRR